MFKKSERGFTLIELLVVIAILGVLSGIAVPRVLGGLEAARVNANAANIAILQSAVDRWAIDNNQRGTPAGWDDLIDGGLPLGVAARLIVAAELVPDYIAAFPSHPFGPAPAHTYGLMFTQTGPAGQQVWTARVVSIVPAP